MSACKNTKMLVLLKLCVRVHDAGAGENGKKKAKEGGKERRVGVQASGRKAAIEIEVELAG